MYKKFRFFLVIYSKIAKSWDSFIEEMFGMGSISYKKIMKNKKN